MYKHLPIEPYAKDQRYIFIENLPVPRVPGEPIGHVDAIDPLTGQQKWRVPLIDLQNWSAMLATGGGLLFTGRETGEFLALDADTGKTLWSLHQRQAVTSMHNGRRYVTVLAGVGGLYWNIAKEQLKKRLGLDLALMPE